MDLKQKIQTETERVSCGISFWETEILENKSVYQKNVLHSFEKATKANARHYIAVTPLIWVEFINELLEFGASNDWIYRPDLTTCAYKWITMTFQKVEEGGCK